MDLKASSVAFTLAARTTAFGSSERNSIRGRLAFYGSGPPLGQPRQLLPELQRRREEITIALQALQDLCGFEHQPVRAARLQRRLHLVPRHRRGRGGALSRA